MTNKPSPELPLADMGPLNPKVESPPSLLTELNRAKVLFQQRAIMAAMGVNPDSVRDEPVSNRYKLEDQAYRGLTCHFEYPPIPCRQWDWIATDPNGEGEVLANGATLDELKADVDRYFEEQE